MFKFVDDGADTPISGYAYINLDGIVENVGLLNGDIVHINVSGEYVAIYVNDVPKLILALQAAYDHVKGK